MPRLGAHVDLTAPLADLTVWPGVADSSSRPAAACCGGGRVAWPAIGVHAAWVAVFRVGRLFFDIRRRPAWLVGPGWPPLVGGAAGALALVATALLVRAWLRRRRARFA
jgi:hypothetical protein